MATWDRQPPAQRDAVRAAALRAQVLDAVAPFSPYWQERLAALRREPADVATLEGLRALPAVGERDLCPDGDPAGTAALVLQAGEQGWALHAAGPSLRRALRRRLTAVEDYRAQLESDVRPTSYAWAGLSLRWPVASTRSDLDLLARAGARLWALLGLDRTDVLVAALPPLRTPALQLLELAALASGAPALFPGADPDEVAQALRLVPATVLAVPTDGAAQRLSGLHLSGLRVLLLVGAPTDGERERAREAARQAGAPRELAVLAVHAPDGHRLLWADCGESASAPAGLHTMPDLEVVQLVEPETGAPATTGEPVVTQLGLRGSALLRWRTGDLAEQVVEDRPCPACGRTVPRVVGVRRTALVPEVALPDGARRVDLRAVAGALLARSEVADWRVQLTAGRRGEQVLVHLAPVAGADPAEAAVAAGEQVRSLSGLLPSQVVLGRPGALPASGLALTRRIVDARG